MNSNRILLKKRDSEQQIDEYAQWYHKWMANIWISTFIREFLAYTQYVLQLQFLKNDFWFPLHGNFLWLFSLYFIDKSRQDLWQVGNYFCFLSLFACLSLNYHIVPTLPVKVKQLRGCRPLGAMLGGAPMGISWFLCCASTVDGGCLCFPPGASLCWDELTCSPGAAVGGRERESEGIYTWQG